MEYALPGDILFYDRHPDWIDDLIITGERLEDGLHRIEAYHVAVALDSYQCVAALARGVSVTPIDYGVITICRPLSQNAQTHQALMWAESKVGTPYGWLGIVDQALRDVSHNLIHLPDALIEWSNQKWPYCSIFATDFLQRAGYEELRDFPPPSPEDLWLELKQFRVG
ncbi:hypothetical protein ACOJUR_12005 [Alicyclobacillus tolerans]|uniref:hypothetical protein n=1 Tax=Alicyclobacillus tolerans TaxID=90970 RepID=UPI003B7D29F9